MRDLEYDILSIQERAVASAKKGNKVINGCAGMLFEDNKELCLYDDVNEKIRDNFDDYLAYPEVLGSKEYKGGVLSWLFRDKKKDIEEKYNIAFSVTLGGTGAISMAFNNLAFKNGIALLSDIRWPNYDTICHENHLPFAIYDFIIDGKLNINSIRQALEEQTSKYPFVLLVINDPCHNPLGYCMSKDDYKNLFDVLKDFSSQVALMLDIAYIDYDPLDRYYEEMLLSLDVSFPVHLTFSCSKSFGLYGLRVGALISLYQKKVDINPILDDMRAYARGTYSCANNGAMGPIALFFSDEKAKSNVRAKLEEEKKRLFENGTYLSDVLDELGISHFPYKGGFYLTFNIDDSYEFCKKLEEKEIYFAPIDKTHMRIAVSGLNKDDISELKRRLENK